MSIFQGLLAGFATIIFVGPVFFYLLKTSLAFGSINGILVAIGIIISDISAVWLCYIGFAKLLTTDSGQFWLSAAGGFILMGMGMFYLLNKHATVKDKNLINRGGRIMFLVNGFLINFVNPFVFGIWIGLISYAGNLYESATDVKLYLLGTLIGIFSTDVSKVLLSKYLQPILNAKRLLVIYRIVGILLLVFGMRLLVFAYSILANKMVI